MKVTYKRERTHDAAAGRTSRRDQREMSIPEAPTPCPAHRFVRFRTRNDPNPRVGVLLAPSEEKSSSPLVHAPRFCAHDASTAIVPSTMREALTMYVNDHRSLRVDASLSTPLEECELLCAVDRDVTIACVGKNYLEHVGEVDSTMPGISRMDVPEAPIIFSKASTSLNAHLGSIATRGRKDVDYEGELVAVIGRECRDIDPGMSDEDVVKNYVIGWSIANDVTARELQKTHQQWFLGKSGDTHCPLGPWVCCDDGRAPALGAASITTAVNSEIRQRSTVDQLIWSVGALIACISRHQTLRVGDCVLTGTPSGVGAGFDPPRFLQPGDACEVTIEGVGTLKNTVVENI